MLDLGDRVLRTVGPEPIRARLEVRLEDGFQHRLQGCLHDPIGHRRDAQFAHLAVGLGDLNPPRRRRAEGAGAKLLTDPGEELLFPEQKPDTGNSQPVHSCRLCTLVAGHPRERVDQERRVVDQVVQITETPRGILPRPSVQLQLHPPYLQGRHLR